LTILDCERGARASFLLFNKKKKVNFLFPFYCFQQFRNFQHIGPKKKAVDHIGYFNSQRRSSPFSPFAKGYLSPVCFFVNELTKKTNFRLHDGQTVSGFKENRLGFCFPFETAAYTQTHNTNTEKL
jgi:hypothetical protein